MHTGGVPTFERTDDKYCSEVLYLSRPKDSNPCYLLVTSYWLIEKCPARSVRRPNRQRKGWRLSSLFDTCSTETEEAGDRLSSHVQQVIPTDYPVAHNFKICRLLWRPQTHRKLWKKPPPQCPHPLPIPASPPAGFCVNQINRGRRGNRSTFPAIFCCPSTWGRILPHDTSRPHSEYTRFLRISALGVPIKNTSRLHC